MLPVYHTSNAPVIPWQGHLWHPHYRPPLAAVHNRLGGLAHANPRVEKSPRALKRKNWASPGCQTGDADGANLRVRPRTSRLSDNALANDAVQVAPVVMLPLVVLLPTVVPALACRNAVTRGSSSRTPYRLHCRTPQPRSRVCKRQPKMRKCSRVRRARTVREWTLMLQTWCALSYLPTPPPCPSYPHVHACGVLL